MCMLAKLWTGNRIVFTKICYRILHPSSTVLFPESGETASLSSSPSPPFLDIPELRHSLLPLCDITLCTRLWGLVPPLQLLAAGVEVPCSCGLIRVLIKRNHLLVWPKTVSEASALEHSSSSITLLKHFISMLEAVKFCTTVSMQQNESSLESAEEVEEASIRGRVGQKLLDLSIKLREDMFVTLIT